MWVGEQEIERSKIKIYIETERKEGNAETER
jgi:hypothetical protein